MSDYCCYVSRDVTVRVTRDCRHTVRTSSDGEMENDDSGDGESRPSWKVCAKASSCPGDDVIMETTDTDIAGLSDIACACPGR